MRGERRESGREDERLIAMARKQREKDPRPRPQPPRTSQARRVAGIIVGPGSMVPGTRSARALSVARSQPDLGVAHQSVRSHGKARNHILSFFMDLDRNCYCKPVTRDLFFIFVGSWQESIL